MKRGISFRRPTPHLRFYALKKRRTDEANTRMTRSLGFQHNGKYLRAFGLQLQAELRGGNGYRNEICIKFSFLKRRKNKPAN